MNKEENNIQTEEKISTSVFFVEANSYEILSLWKEYAKETEWEQDNHGFSQRIGWIDNNEKFPVFVSFMFAKIFGKRICFYETTSRYNDTVLVENWIKENYPVKWDNNTRTAITNAMNFHHAIYCCRNDI